MANYKQKLNTRTGQFNLVNDAGLLFFKDSVANVAALPAVGNTVNDARIVLDTYNLYVWSGTAWINQGDVLNIDWSTIENKPSSSVADIDNAVSIRHTQNTDKYLATQVTKVLYVDGNRTDIYIADGSLTKPYLTIQAAINKVIANGDNSETKVYVIKISSGVYAENVVLNNVNIKELVMIGEPGCVFIDPPSGYAMECSADNALFRTFMVYNIDFNKAVYFVGSAGTPTWHHTWVNDCWFIDCSFWGKVTVKNVVCFEIGGTNQNVDNDMDLENVYVAALSGGNGHNPGQTINVVTNMANPHYVDFSETLLIIESTLCGNVNIGAGSRVQFRYAVRVAGGTVTINGILQAYNSWIGAGTITLGAAGTFTARGTFWTPAALTITPGGTLTRETYAGCIRNVPAGTIAATDVQSAINELDTEKYSENTEIKIKVYSQNSEPALSADSKMAIWIDTDDSNRVYLVFRRGTGDQVAVELA